MNLPVIPNAAPVTADAQNLWVNSVSMFGNRLNAQLLPYDKAKGLLVLGGTPTFVRVADTTKDAAVSAVVPAVVAEMRRQGIAAGILPAGDTSAAISVNCFAPAPNRPILMVAQFGTKESAKVVRVNDCEKLSATDATFAGVFVSALGAIIAKV